ncbi:porin family protein [Chryseobacterium daeguense]|uniref:porin family protein n=1 Tax=Chryseobacterium daeguense TaxID=412438 RepID=UPI0003FEBE32|nr:porin family protein [Chryseobacterium daeguense]
MKKLLLGLAVIAGSFTFAQKTSSSPVTFGLKAGLNVSNISGGNSKAGFYGGAFMNAPIASNFSIQPEVLYNGLGSKIKDENITVNFNYISVPVMFQYNALPNLYLEAGPQFSFSVGSNLKYDSQTIDKGNLVKAKSFDFGIGLGAGYYFNKNIGVTARYVAGVTDAFKEIGGVKNIDGKNSAFQVGLAYKF